MRLMFKQRLFSWFDSYDIYDSKNNTVFTVKGEFSWKLVHKLRVFDSEGNELGVMQQRFLSLTPKFEIYCGGEYVGSIIKGFTFMKPTYYMSYKSWTIEGDIFEWDYEIIDRDGKNVAYIIKKLMNLTDTYVLNISKNEDALHVLMLVLAIDADKCSRKH